MRWIVFFAALTLLPSAWGFGISPCLRKLTFGKGVFSEKPTGTAHYFNRCGDLPLDFKNAVHEHITLVTIAHYRGGEVLDNARKGYTSDYMNESAWISPHGRRHATRGIVFGTWWNDDPLRHSWGQRGDLARGAGNALVATMTEATEYVGAGDCKVPRQQHLARHSHFDKLQHLHFMTPLDPKTSQAAQRVESTTNLALGWMQFAYEVAKGTHRADKPLQQVAEFMKSDGSLPSLDDVRRSNCAGTQENVKVWTLFTQRDKTWPSKMRIAITPDIALGSMLHVIQDAFSPGHACRVKKAINGKTYSVIADAGNYKHQSSSSHRRLDGYPTWLAPRLRDPDERSYENDPVSVGVWLMGAVDRRLDWIDVDRHLRNTIFLSEPRDGEADCIGGRAQSR